MAKVKADWIKEINAFGSEALGDVTQEQLLEMNVGQLKMLKKEIEEEIAAGVAIVEKQLTDANTPKEETVTDTPANFASMCGSEFDPKKAGSCHKQCSQDFPEAFKACSENFSKKPEKKTSAPKRAGGGKTVWNHVVNSQAGKIDECIIAGKPMSLAEIAKYAEGKEPRCLDHLKHLVFDWKIDILITKRKKEDGKDEDIYFWSEKDKRRTGDKLAGKSAYKQ